MADIEVVIRIPKETYDYIKKQVAEGIDNPLKVYIANGTPLPKEHGKIIDYGDVVDAIDDWVNATDYLRKRVANTPTIIEADKESEDA